MAHLRKNMANKKSRWNLECEALLDTFCGARVAPLPEENRESTTDDTITLSVKIPVSQLIKLFYMAMERNLALKKMFDEEMNLIMAKAIGVLQEKYGVRL